MEWKNRLLFVSAQPDVPYFHWQCEIYLKNFISLGIPSENIHVIFALVKGSSELSDGAQNLCKYTNNIHFYQDNRIKKHYIPSIKPYLIHQWLGLRVQALCLWYLLYSFDMPCNMPVLPNKNQ